MVLLQTPLNKEDLISTTTKDTQWASLKFSCFDAKGESTWPSRFPTEMLRLEKEAHIRRGQLGLWMREMECEIVPDGGTSFNPENLRFWDITPVGMTYVITIDPASSDSKEADDQVIAVLGFWKSDVYLMEYTANKGEMPEAAVATLMEYITRYRPLCVVVESISYQRVLAHFIEQEMRRQRRFVPVHRVQDRRRKADRILQAIGATSGYGRLLVKATHFGFIEQYNTYSPLSREHDDILDAVSMGIDYGASLGMADWIEGEFEEEEAREDVKSLEFRSCP
jgi:phage terminase large subunit-like protein